jgi:DNA-binding MarR family transcriptional regulator
LTAQRRIPLQSLLAPIGQVILDDRESRQGVPMAADFTPRQGQFLAFIYYYTKIHRIPPAETDMQRFFRISPPAVHEMVKTLDRQGFITREPGKPRTIRVLLPRDKLPDLE